MPYQKTYTSDEARFMLQVYEGAHAFRGANAAHQIQRHGAAAHAALHGGAGFDAQRTRVNTPGQPRTTGTFHTTDDQVAALTHALNSVPGQAALGQLDANPGQREISFNAGLPPGRFQMTNHADVSSHLDAHGNALPGHVAKNNAARIGAGSTQTRAAATGIYVLAMRAPGGKLQIQTCYPT